MIKKNSSTPLVEWPWCWSWWAPSPLWKWKNKSRHLICDGRPMALEALKRAKALKTQIWWWMDCIHSQDWNGFRKATKRFKAEQRKRQNNWCSVLAIQMQQRYTYCSLITVLARDVILKRRVPQKSCSKRFNTVQCQGGTYFRSVLADSLFSQAPSPEAM